MKTFSSIAAASRVLTGILCSLSVVLAAPAVAASSFPDRPVKLVVPYAPGGTLDIFARVLAEGAAPLLGQPVVVENRPGAGGTIGGSAVARSAPDGYTLYVTDLAPLVISRVLFKNLDYDPVTDLAPVTLGTVSSLAVVVHPSVPANNLQELVELARSKPGTLNFSSAGNGSILHGAGELFKLQSKLDIVHVPYKGGAPAVQAVAAGEVQLGFLALPTTLPLREAGKMRLLAVTQPERSRLAPELPTIAESGFPDYEVTVWQGILAPKGTPADVITTLNKAFREALAKPEVKGRLEKQGFDIVTTTPEEFGAYIKKEAEKWEGVVKEAGIRTE